MKNLSRRGLLAGMAGATFASMSRSSLLSGQAGTTPPRKFYSVLSCGALGVKASFEHGLELASRFGFEGIDPDPAYFAQAGEAGLKGLLASMQQKKVKFGSAGLPVEFRQDNEVFSAGLKKLPDVASWLEKAGVKRVTTWILSFSNEYTYTENFRWHTLRLRECARILGDFGLVFGLEYVGPKTAWRSSRYPFLHTLAETRELVEAIGLKNVGVQLDSWHWFNAEETQADLLKLKNEDVVSVHLNDAPAGVPLDKQVDNRRELPLATGVIPMKDFIQGLRMIGYDGPVAIEPFSAALRTMTAEKACETTAAAMKRTLEL